MKLKIKAFACGSIGGRHIEIDYMVEVEYVAKTNDTPGSVEAGDILEFEVTAFYGEGDPYYIDPQDFVDALVGLSNRAKERAVEIVSAGDFDEMDAA